MELHYIDGSPFARMVRVLAREYGIRLVENEITEFPPDDSLFGINPLGQVPVLVDNGIAYFPTRIAIAHLQSKVSGQAGEVSGYVARAASALADEQLMSVILEMGSFLAAHHYADWAGLRQAGPNRLGFDPSVRNMIRVLRALDWLEQRAGRNSFLPGAIGVQDIALTCLILWSESRGKIAWRGRPKIEAIVDRLIDRSSFRETEPRPHMI